MRISGDPTDQDYIGDTAVAVIIDRKFFAGGPIRMADEAAGVIEYHPVDAAGNYIFDQTAACWKIARVTGAVRIFVEPARC